MKSSSLLVTLVTCLFVLNFNPEVFGQYLEAFSMPNKGVLVGPCGATATTCASHDFDGVNWSINGNFSGLDSGDLLSTTSAGVLRFHGDIDEELCFESPILDISTAGTVSLSVDINWTSHDVSDYLDVEYQINNGTWQQIPNQFGGGTHTIDFGTDVNTGSGTISQGGLTGSTLSVRVCVDTNSSGDNTTIDNVTVSEAGVSILPVELSSFTATKVKDEIVLEWATITETNNDKFEIEYSTDGRTFQKIGEVSGSGTTYNEIEYFFNHKVLPSSSAFYRLKQIDFDGQFNYSRLVFIESDNKDNKISEFYPNPSNSGMVQIQYFSPEKSLIEISLFNIEGKLLSNFTKQLEEKNNILDFDFSNLQKGLYIVKFGKTASYRKLIISNSSN